MSDRKGNVTAADQVAGLYDGLNPPAWAKRYAGPADDGCTQTVADKQSCEKPERRLEDRVSELERQQCQVYMDLIRLGDALTSDFSRNQGELLDYVTAALFAVSRVLDEGQRSAVATLIDTIKPGRDFKESIEIVEAEATLLGF